MKSNLAMVLSAVTTFAALAVPAQLIGQEQSGIQLPQSHHTHYKVVFIGTFGGPNSHFSIGGTHILNNDGSFVGWADDSLPDPFAPDGCWDGDCFVARAFRFKSGKMTDLGALAPSFSSDASWLSPGGLISGEAQTGEVDPNLGWTMHGILWAHGQMIDWEHWTADRSV